MRQVMSANNRQCRLSTQGNYMNKYKNIHTINQLNINSYVNTCDRYYIQRKKDCEAFDKLSMYIGG